MAISFLVFIVYTFACFSIAFEQFRALFREGNSLGEVMTMAGAVAIWMAGFWVLPMLVGAVGLSMGYTTAMATITFLIFAWQVIDSLIRWNIPRQPLWATFWMVWLVLATVAYYRNGII